MGSRCPADPRTTGSDPEGRPGAHGGGSAPEPATGLACLGTIVFATGAPGLEVLWQRRLSVRFGNTVEATGAVLAAFLGSLAIGSSLLGRVADPVASPLRLYGLLEVLAGLGALLALACSELIGEVGAAAFRATGGDSPVLTVLLPVAAPLEPAARGLPHDPPGLPGRVPDAIPWYPHAALSPNTIVAGARDGFRFSGRSLLEGMKTPGIAADLAEIGIRDPATCLGNYVTAAAGLRRLVDGSEPHTDDRPRVEHAAGRLHGEHVASYRAWTWRENFRSLLEVWEPWDRALGSPASSQVRRELEGYLSLLKREAP